MLGATWVLHAALFALCCAQVALIPSTSASRLVHGFLLGVLAAVLLFVNLAPGARESWSRYQGAGIVAMVVAITVLAALVGGEGTLVSLYAIPIAVAALTHGRIGVVLVTGVCAVVYVALAALLSKQPVGAAPFIMSVVGDIVPAFAVAWVLATIAARARNAAKQLEDLASRDPVTGLLNAPAFEEVLEQEHRKAERFGRTYALVVIGIDDVSDSGAAGGPEASDRPVAAVAAALERAMRSSDVAARIGTNELVLFSAECTTDTVATVVERIRSAVRSSVAAPPAGASKAAVSVGVGTFPADHLYPRELLALARQRMRHEQQRNALEPAQPDP
jgi:diguanylate cyclase (GGDEF)-like protein